MKQDLQEARDVLRYILDRLEFWDTERDRDVKEAAQKALDRINYEPDGDDYADRAEWKARI